MNKNILNIFTWLVVCSILAAPVNMNAMMHDEPLENGRIGNSTPEQFGTPPGPIQMSDEVIEELIQCFQLNHHDPEQLRLLINIMLNVVADEPHRLDFEYNPPCRERVRFALKRSPVAPLCNLGGVMQKINQKNDMPDRLEYILQLCYGYHDYVRFTEKATSAQQIILYYLRSEDLEEGMPYAAGINTAASDLKRPPFPWTDPSYYSQHKRQNAMDMSENNRQ